MMEEKRQMDFADLDAYSRRQDYHRDLRLYQQENKSAIYKAWGEGKTSVMLQMPTGTGKTHLFASLIKDIQDYTYDRASATRRGIAKILVLVHRIELIEQIQKTLTVKYRHECGIVSGPATIWTTRNVIVASVATLSRRKRLHSWEEDVDFDFIIIDEAHHSTADSYQRIRRAWPQAWLLGVTATPYRLNHQPFTDIYDELIVSQPVYRFIEQGYLCNYDYYSIPPNSEMQYQINHLKTDFTGDYNERAMEELMSQDRIRSGIFEAYERFAKGKKGIVYTINRRHNMMLAALFKKRGGCRVAYIDSETPKEERARAVDDFKRGEIDIIFNVNIFSEGFDCPDVEFIQLVRPTKSLSMYLQQVGRGFRTAKGKEKVLFLDNVRLFNRFGLPSANRHWRHHFEGREDWDEPRNGLEGMLEEHEYHEADLSEGNEEMKMVYTSVEEQEEEKVVETVGAAEAEDTDTIAMDTNDELIVLLDRQQYDLAQASMAEVLQVLLAIEEKKHSGVIDTEGIGRRLEQWRREEALDALVGKMVELGFTREEILEAYASSGNATEQAVVADPSPKPVGKGLYVVTPDNRVVKEKKDVDTFIRAIEMAGVARVHEAEIPTLRYYLVSDKPHPQYPQRSYAREGFYIVVNHSNTQKKALLEMISDKLSLGWKVYVNE